MVDATYCGHCGERLLGHHELSLGAQIEQVFHGLFHLDGRVGRSFLLLITRPGFLAAEYCRGARVRYMKPVQLFLVANLAYFLLQPYFGFGTFNSTLEMQLGNQFYSVPLRSVVEERLAETGESKAAYAERFDRKASALSRSLVLLLIPVFAGLLAVLFRRRGRRFPEHIVLATHHVAFQLAFLYLPALWGIGQLARRGWLPRFEIEWEVSLMLLDLAWWTFASRRFYGSGPWVALGKAVLLSVAMLPAVLGYRYVLFWITFWST